MLEQNVGVGNKSQSTLVQFATAEDAWFGLSVARRFEEKAPVSIEM